MDYYTALIPFEGKNDRTGHRVFELASTATSKSTFQTAGGSFTAYGLEPVLWARKAIDAAKEKMRFLQIVSQYNLPQGHKDYVILKRKQYLPETSWESSSEEYAVGTEIPSTEITTPGAITVTPINRNYQVHITNDNIRTSAINAVQYCRDELAYLYENCLDSLIRDTLIGTITPSSGTPVPGAVEYSNTTAGSMTIFGGDATDASNSLDDGDILTTELIKKARRLLQSNIGYYWSSNVWTKSAVYKNPWTSEPNEPFVLLIAPEQEEALLNESQFTSAAEYGSQKVVLSGEIGTYMDVKVLTTTKMPHGSSGYKFAVSGANNRTFDTNVHMCAMLKAKRVGAAIFGRTAEFKIYDYPQGDAVRIKLSFAVGVDNIYDDAQVRIFVTDQ